MTPTIPATLEEIGKLAGRFGNAYIIIEGNTDASRKGIVPTDLVRQLSYDRADAVRKAIMDKYQFDPNKFKVVGNGWDNPLPGCTDPSNAENNKKNRRVEVKVFPLESGLVDRNSVVWPRRQTDCSWVSDWAVSRARNRRRRQGSP